MDFEDFAMNEKWKPLIEAINTLPECSELEKEVHLPSVFEREIETVGDRLAEMLERGISFNVSVNYVTPKGDLTADDRQFLNRHRKQILMLLQMDTLYKKGCLQDYQTLLEFNLDFINRIRALFRLSTGGKAAERVTKGLQDITRRYFAALVGDKSTQIGGGGETAQIA